MNHKICFFNRSAVHYRIGIYKILSKELNVDFFFGDKRPGGIKSIDYKALHNFKGLFKNVDIGPFYWQKGVFKSLLGKYTDVITTGDTYCLSSWFFLLFAPLFHEKVYLWTIGAMGGEKRLERFIIKIKSFLTAGTMVYGERAKKLLIDYGVNPKKICVIYNSLDYDEQIKLRKTISKSNLYNNHFQNDNYNIVFIGRLVPRRKIEMLIEAASKLKIKGLPVNVTIIGDGPVKESLFKTAETFHFDTLWLYGSLYDEVMISDFLYNADLVVSPGSMGLAAMHALTFGCPIITHDNFNNLGPECEAIIRGVNGDQFVENDVDSLSSTIEKWFIEHPDREAVRLACYKIIDEKYNPHNQISIIKSFIIK